MTKASDSENKLELVSESTDGLLENVALPKPAEKVAQVDQRLTELNGLLADLEVTPAANYKLPPVISESVDNQLIQVRLGIASSLFAALQCKHAATAGHSLRVSLTCSSWAIHMGLTHALHGRKGPVHLSLPTDVLREEM